MGDLFRTGWIRLNKRGWRVSLKRKPGIERQIPQFTNHHLETTVKKANLLIRRLLCLVALISGLSGDLSAQSPLLKLGMTLSPEDVAIMQVRFFEVYRECLRNEAGTGVYDEVLCLMVEGMVGQGLGRREEYKKSFEKAAELLEGRGNAFGLILLRSSQGESDFIQGHPEEAAHHFEEALERLNKLEASSETIQLDFVERMMELMVSEENARLFQLGKSSAALMRGMLINTTRSRIHQLYSRLLSAQGENEKAAKHLELAQEAGQKLFGTMTWPQGTPGTGPTLPQIIIQPKIEMPKIEPNLQPQPKPDPEGDLDAEENSPMDFSEIPGSLQLALNLGQSDSLSGDYVAAIRHLNQALEELNIIALSDMDSEMKNEIRVRALSQIALAHDMIGNSEEAHATLRKARSFVQETDQLQGDVSFLLRYLEDGQRARERGTLGTDQSIKESTEMLGQSFERFKSNTEPRSRHAHQLIVQAVELFHKKRFERAIFLAKDAKIISLDLGMRDRALDALALKIGLHLVDSNFREALEPALESIDLLESVADDMGIDEARMGYLARHNKVYGVATYLLRWTGQTSKAFLCSEKSRARGLLYLLGGQRPMKTQGVNPSMMRSLETLREERGRLYGALQDVGPIE